MKKSLAVKMFVTLLVSFLAVITITLSFLFMYFQYFYEDEKIGRVIDAMNNFSDEYLKEDWTEPQLYQNIANFSNENGLEFSVYDYEYANDFYEEDTWSKMVEEFEKSNDSYYYITTVNQDSYYDFMLTAPEYNTLKSFNTFNNSDGIELTGYIDSYNFLIVEMINGIGIESASAYIEENDMSNFQTFKGSVVIQSAQEIFDIDVKELQDESIVIQGDGVITNVIPEGIDVDQVENNMISEEKNIIYGKENEATLEKENEAALEEENEATLKKENEAALEEEEPGLAKVLIGDSVAAIASAPDVVLESFVLEDYNFESKEKNGVAYTISHIPYTDYNQVSFSKMVNDGESDIEFYGFLSMQPVGEIIEMIASVVPYFLIGSLLLALFLSYFYSRTVAKPIVDITKVADRMAAMDLDVCAPINRDDELGNLSMSLNTLASNLRDSMDELMMRNKQLALDVERKIQQEDARKAFVANASHELKTPLGVIKSYTEAIHDGIKIEKKDYYMSVIMDEISHMDKLIQEMLMLSKYDGGVEIYNKSNFDLDLIMNGAKESLIKTAQKKNMTINIKTPLGNVMGDQEKIYQVIMNLLANAIKYGNENSDIRIEAIEKSSYREIYFYNECENIDEAELEKLWNRFYKVDLSHNKKIEGNGLGLAIVKSILEGHEAKFGVYNTMKGICFYFCLDKV